MCNNHVAHINVQFFKGSRATANQIELEVAAALKAIAGRHNVLLIGSLTQSIEKGEAPARAFFNPSEDRLNELDKQVLERLFHDEPSDIDLSTTLPTDYPQ